MNTRETMTTRAMREASGSNATGPLDSPVSAFEQGREAPGTEVARLRSRILEHCPKFRDRALAQFMQQAFALDDVVRAYFCPKALPDGIVVGVDPGPNAGPVILAPFEEAYRAASQTWHSVLLERAGRLDRALAFVAALLYPCGLFLNCHPAWRPPGQGGEITHSRARDLSFMALAPALQTLRRSRSGIAQAFATALGHNSVSGHCIGNGNANANANAGELLSSMVAAVYMANLRVAVLWNLQASKQLDRRTS